MSDSTGAWWLTPGWRGAACQDCGRELGVGKSAVYRHEPRAVLCLRCSTLARVCFRPSSRWERRHGEGKSARPEAAGRSKGKPKGARARRAEQPRGWRWNRTWMTDAEWTVTCAAMAKQIPGQTLDS